MLQVINMEPEFDEHPNEVSHVKMTERPMHRDEIVRLCKILGIDHDGTIPELRDRIRAVVINRDKAGSSRFSTRELWQLVGAAKTSLRLDADEVDIYDEIPQWGGQLSIVTEDGEHDVEVVDKGKASWKDRWGDQPNYSEYEMYVLAANHFDDNRRRRLMVLRDLDYDQCKYRGSVVLERKVDYGPYQRWKKQSYVQEVDIA